MLGSWGVCAGVSAVEELVKLVSMSARDLDLERRRSLEPMTEPLRLRRRGMRILSKPMIEHRSPYDLARCESALSRTWSIRFSRRTKDALRLLSSVDSQA